MAAHECGIVREDIREDTAAVAAATYPLSCCSRDCVAERLSAQRLGNSKRKFWIVEHRSFQLVAHARRLIVDDHIHNHILDGFCRPFIVECQCRGICKIFGAALVFKRGFDFRGCHLVQQPNIVPVGQYGDVDVNGGRLREWSAEV